MMANIRWRQPVLIGILMFSASIGAAFLRPAAVSGNEDVLREIDLESIVPRRFGIWHVDDSLAQFVVSPDVRERLDIAYDRLLSRIYVNDQGEKIMLLVAYGRSQIGGDLQVHRPEGCYAAQGFLIGQKQPDHIVLRGKALPVVRIVATKGRRIERITYWARVGDRFVRGYFDQAFARLAVGLTGRHPDGLLFRVSTLEQDAEHSNALQDAFIRDVMTAIPGDRQTLLIGRWDN